MDLLAQRLRTAREHQKLSVRDLSVITKIREPYIVAIEAGRYDILPAVYMRSFIRTLATALDIKTAELQSLMNEVFDPENEIAERFPRGGVVQQQEQPNVISEAVQKASRSLERPVGAVKSFAASNVLSNALQRKNAFLYLLAGVIVLASLVYLIFFYAGRDERATSSIPELEIKLDDVPDVVGTDSLVLTAIVTDTAWMTITADGSRTQQMVMIPGINYRWSANDKFVLSLNNAGGIRFARNGQALPLFGNQGEAVRSVLITRTDIVSSAQAQQQVRQLVQPAAPPTKPSARPSAKPKPRYIDPRSTPLITPTQPKSPLQRKPPP